MQEVNPWRVPGKKKGESLENYTFRMDPLFKQAIQELAQAETGLYGVKISLPTVISNLTTRNGNYFVEKRATLNKRYKQLNREKQANERTVSNIK